MRVEVVRVAAPASTGDLDFTVSGAGTCIGAEFFLSLASVDNTAANNAAMGYGATDGTRQFAIAAYSQHSQPATNTVNRGMTDQCLALTIATGAIDGEAAFSSFITDGVRVNIGNAFGFSSFIVAVLYFRDDGSNDQFYVGTFDTSSADDDVTEPGFEPDLVKVGSIRNPLDDTSRNGATFSIGFAHNHPSLGTPPQCSMNFGEGDNIADGAPRMRVESALVCADHNASTLLGQVEIDGFDSSGFTAVRTNGAGYACGYVAIKCLNPIDVDLHSTPTSTGAQSFGTGLPPMATFGFLTRLGATESTDLSGLAGSFGLFAFTTASIEFSASAQSEDLSGTTDTQSMADSKAINLPEHDGTTDDGIDAAVSSILSNGFELTFNTTSAAACLFGVAAIGFRHAGTGAGNAPVPVGSATAALEFAATGAGSSLAPVGAGSAALEFTGTGAGTAPAATGAATATLEFVASGVGVAPAPTGAGTATHTANTFTGTGAGFAPVPQGVGAAEHEFAGTAAGVAPVPVGSGVAVLEFAGSAQGTAPAPEGSGQALLEFSATGNGVAPVPFGDADALLEFLAIAAGFAPAPVGAGVATHVGFELPPMICPTQLEGSYVVAAALLGRYLPSTALLGSREPVTQLEGEVC